VTRFNPAQQIQSSQMDSTFDTTHSHHTNNCKNCTSL